MLEVKGDGSACSAEMLLKPLPVHGFLKHTYIPRWFPIAAFLIYSLLVLPIFFWFLNWYGGGGKNAFYFPLLSPPKNGNWNVLSSMLCTHCFLEGFPWVGNFWNSEGRGKTILKTTTFFAREKQSLPAICRKKNIGQNASAPLSFSNYWLYIFHLYFVMSSH